MSAAVESSFPPPGRLLCACSPSRSSTARCCRTLLPSCAPAFVPYSPVLGTFFSYHYGHGHALLRPHPVPASDGISLSAVSASDAQLYCAGLQPAPFRPRAALSLAAAPSRLSDSQPPIRPIFGKCCPFSPRNGPFKIKLHREPPHLPYTKLWTRSLVGIRPTRQLVSPGSNPPSRVFKNS